MKPTAKYTPYDGKCKGKSKTAPCSVVGEEGKGNSKDAMGYEEGTTVNDEGKGKSKDAIGKGNSMDAMGKCKGKELGANDQDLEWIAQEWGYEFNAMAQTMSYVFGRVMMKGFQKGKMNGKASMLE